MSLYDAAGSQAPQIDAEALWFQMMGNLPAPEPRALSELERLDGLLKEDLLAALPDPSERCASSSPERRVGAASLTGKTKQVRRLLANEAVDRGH